MKSCPNCGFQCEPTDRECPKCGIIFEKYYQFEEKKKSRGINLKEKLTERITRPFDSETFWAFVFVLILMPIIICGMMIWIFNPSEIKPTWLFVLLVFVTYYATCASLLFVITKTENLRICVIVIGAFVVCLGLIGKTTFRETYSSSMVSNSPWDNSVSQVEDYLGKSLKDPGSYEGLGWSDVAKGSDGKCQVRHRYRAKNSFGGYVVEEKVFTLDSKGNVIDSHD